MGDVWMSSEKVPRCESCGLRLEGGETTTLCKSCTYRRKKQEQRAAAAAAAEAQAPTKPVEPVKAPDVEELRDRLRRVEETLRQPPPG